MKKKEQQPQQQPLQEQPTIEQPTIEQPTTEQPTNKNALHQPENLENPESPENPENPDTPESPESPDTPQPPHAPDFKLSEAFLSLAEDDQEAAGHWLDLILTQLTNNALTAETLQMVLHALHYDHDVAQAGIDGEVKGRNARIEELFEQKRKTADIHMLGGAISHTPSTLPTDIIGGLSAADRQTIWERGNEKRVILR
jgi:outer membrane biosynthesis protein TonB